MNYQIGTVIRKVRKDKGISVKELAEKTNISVEYIYAVESNRNSPSFKIIKKIADALDYPVAIIMMKALEDDPIAQKYANVLEALVKLE